MNARIRGILVILAAVLVGAAADRALTREHKHESWTGVPNQFQRLGLTEQQKTEMTRIIRAQKPRADSLMKDVLPRVKAMELEMKQQLACVLTKQQQDEWMEWRRRKNLNMKEAEVWLQRVKSGKCNE